MISRILLFSCVILMVACSPAADLPAPTDTQAAPPTDTPTIANTITQTLTTTETATITDTPLPTETPTQTVDPVLAILIYGQKYMQERCSTCHSTDRITNKNASRAAWTSIVDRMISKGAVLNSNERQTLIDYLSMSFP